MMTSPATYLNHTYNHWLKIERRAPRSRIWDVWTRGQESKIVGSDFPSHRAAEEAAAVAMSLVAAFRAASERKYSKVDFMMEQAAREIGYRRDALIRELRRVEEDAARDRARTEHGWMTDGGLARRGTEADEARLEFKAAWEYFRSLAYVVRETAPDSEAAIALALISFFRGGEAV